MLLHHVHINIAVYPYAHSTYILCLIISSFLTPSPHSWCGGGLRGCDPPDTGGGNGDGGGGGGEEKKERE